jgi:uncharacterized protein (TIGR02246 family)
MCPKMPPILACVILFGAAQSSSPSDAVSATPEQEVRRLSAEEVAAFQQNDSATMARIWSDDFIVTNPFNRFLTKQQVLAMAQSGALAIPSYQRDIQYLHVYKQDTVIVAGSETVVWGGKMPVAGRTQHLRYTAVWMLQNGRWQEVARHASIVAPQE